MKPLDRIRTFIEVRIGERTHRRIIEALAELHPAFSRAGWKVRWVHPDNVHLTLRFLGDIEPTLVGAIQERLARLSQAGSPRIAVRGIGAFPSFEAPRVIWAGIEDRDGKLAELAARIGKGLEDVGIRPDGKPFRPHVTIGRVAQRGGGDAREIVGGRADELFGEEEVREFVFMKSVLMRERAVHTPLWSVALRHRREEPGGEPPPPA